MAHRKAWLRRAVAVFSIRLCETTVLQGHEGDHGGQRVTLKALRGWPLEVIKGEFSSISDAPVRRSVASWWWRPMCAGPSRPADWGDRYFLPREVLFADQPSLLAGKTLLALVLDALRRSIGAIAAM